MIHITKFFPLMQQKFRLMQYSSYVHKRHTYLQMKYIIDFSYPLNHWINIGWSVWCLKELRWVTKLVLSKSLFLVQKITKLLTHPRIFNNKMNWSLWEFAWLYSSNCIGWCICNEIPLQNFITRIRHSCGWNRYQFVKLPTVR